MLNPYPVDAIADSAHAAPFGLDVRISYELSEAGLTVRATATNIGDQPCPYGCGQHPYLSPGQGLVDACTLRCDAATRICTDPERQLPTGTEPVDGTPYDLRAGTVLGDRPAPGTPYGVATPVDHIRVRITGNASVCH